MKYLAPLLLLAVAPVLAQSSDELVPAKRPRLSAEMLRQSTSARAGEIDNEEVAPQSGTLKSDPSLVVMAPFAVTTSALPIQVTHDRPVIAAPVEHPYTWRDGGTILRDDGKVFSVKAGVDYDPEFNVLNLLKISW